jgi:hypothetical protein
MNEQEKRRHFATLAPWHVNGTLDAPDRQWVDDYVRDHPDAAGELRFYESLRQSMRDQAPPFAPETGWDKLQARIRSEQREAPSGWLQRLTHWLGAGDAAGGAIAMRPAYAYAVVAVVVVQAAALGTMWVRSADHEARFAEWRSLQGANATGPVVRVSFKPEAPEREIRALLVGVGGTLIGGPGQLGDYFVRIPDSEVQAAAQKLAQSAIVESVDVIPRLPGAQ